MACLLNILIPGLGLIVRRREWLGFALAVVFGICCNVALAGRLIAPVAIPSWLTHSATAFAVFTWFSGQVLFRHEVVLQRRRAGGVAVLVESARNALDAGDTERARRCLEAGASLDDEHLELHLLLARLRTVVGDQGGARRAWRRVRKLDCQGRFREEAEQGLTAQEGSRESR
jgi:hypothetical protein